jgi:hypothetical protein
MCVITMGFCGHAVPWLSVIGYRHLFLVEPYCCPPCAGTELKRQVVRPMSDSLQVRECVEEVRTPGRGPVAGTELGEFQSGLLLKPKAREV